MISYITIFFGLYFFSFLFILSIAYFFHFILDHSLVSIDEWFKFYFVEMITLSKFISFSLFYKCIPIELNLREKLKSFKWWKKSFLKIKFMGESSFLFFLYSLGITMFFQIQNNERSPLHIPFLLTVFFVLDIVLMKSIQVYKSEKTSRVLMTYFLFSLVSHFFILRGIQFFWPISVSLVAVYYIVCMYNKYFISNFFSSLLLLFHFYNNHFLIYDYEVLKNSHILLDQSSGFFVETIFLLIAPFLVLLVLIYSGRPNLYFKDEKLKNN